MTSKKTKKASSNKKDKKILQNVFVNILAATMWLYITIKIFIFDIDNYVLNHFFPKYIWILKFKIIMIFIVFSLFALVMKKSSFFWNLLYIFAFPLWILFVKIPMFIFKKKSWKLGFVLLSTIISFFRNFKSKIAMLSFFIIFTLIILFIDYVFLLWFSIIGVMCLLFTIYFLQFYSIFTSSSIYELYSKGIELIVKKGNKSFRLNEEIRHLTIPTMDKKQLKEWQSSLEAVIVANKTCGYIASKLKMYKESGINAIFYILNFLKIFFMTVFSFSLTNYGLYQIESANYYIKSPSFFTFIYYSINLSFFNNISDIIPLSSLSKSLVIVQYVFSIILGSVILLLFFSVLKEKHSKEIDSAIKKIDKQKIYLEKNIKQDYNLSVPEAIKELQKLESAMTKLIIFLSKK